MLQRNSSFTQTHHQHEKDNISVSVIIIVGTLYLTPTDSQRPYTFLYYVVIVKKIIKLSETAT